jgi:hypothetical protein
MSTAPKRRRIRQPDFRRLVEPHVAARTSETRTAAIRQARAAHDRWLGELLKASLINATPETAARIKRALGNLKERIHAGTAR